MAIITVNVVISKVCHYLFHPYSANVAIGAIMSQFPSVDPYRWSAWFSAALITAFVAVFRLCTRKSGNATSVNVEAPSRVEEVHSNHLGA